MPEPPRPSGRPGAARRGPASTDVGGGARPAWANRRATGVDRSPPRARSHSRKLAGSESQATRPSSIASTRSAAGRQRSSRCSASTTAVPHSSFRRRSSHTSSSPATGSSCEVGSSSSSSRGRATSAAAMATRWSSPPDSESVRRSSRWPMPMVSATSSTARATAVPSWPRCSSASAISARTPPMTTCDSGSWNTVPHTCASSAGPWSRSSMPPTLRAARERARRGSAGPGRTAPAAASTCPSPTAPPAR